MTTLDELTTPLTVAEAKQAIYDAIEARGASTTAWKSGATARTIIAGLSIVLAAFSQLQAAIAKSGFLTLAEGDWLTLVALHVYGVERTVGTFAAGEVTLTNSGGGVYSGDPGDMIVIDTLTTKTYRNTETYSLGALGTATIAFEAVELGSPSTAPPGEIDDLVTTLPGVTVSNAAALVGTDVETDAALRIRCSEKLGSLSPNGPRDAYAFAARSAVRADGVTSAGVTRVLTVPDGYGGVDVYVASASGEVTGTVGDLGTDLGVVDAAIQEQVVPLAVTATVQSATPLSIGVTYELWVRDTSSLTESLLAADVAADLLEHVTEQPIGGNKIAPAAGKIYVSALESIIGAAVSPDLVKVVITSPAADVNVAVTEVPMLGTIIVTGIHFVAGGA